jgi:Tfp pilus assembly protein PilF
MTGGAREAYDRAVAAAGRGELDAARREFQSVLSADTNAFRAAYNLGVLADRAGQFDEALSYYRQALRIQPDYERALEGIVRIYVRQGRAADAVSFAQPVAERWVRNLAVQAVFADSLVAANRPQDAVTTVRRCVATSASCLP